MQTALRLIVIFLFLSSCGKNMGTFGRGVSITFDPRTVGMQIDDTIMQKSLIGRFINDTPKNSLSCSLVLAVDAYMKGVNLIRVHDVKETINAINIIKHANY